MNGRSNWDSGRKDPNSKHVFASGVATLLIFIVLGTFSNGLFHNIIFYWRACSDSFPLAGFGDVAYKTIYSAVSQTANDFGKYFWNLSLLASGVAAATTGMRNGKPSFYVVCGVWLVSFIVSVAFRIVDSGVSYSNINNVTSLLINGFVVLICWLFSRLFWS